MNEQERVYKEAMKCVDILVKDVMLMIDHIADTNCYEREWVLERFREKFNKANNDKK